MSKFAVGHKIELETKDGLNGLRGRVSKIYPKEEDALNYRVVIYSTSKFKTGREYPVRESELIAIPEDSPWDSNIKLKPLTWHTGPQGYYAKDANGRLVETISLHNAEDGKVEYHLSSYNEVHLDLEAAKQMVWRNYQFSTLNLFTETSNEGN